MLPHLPLDPAQHILGAHTLFTGRLRSRVTCGVCGRHSDTEDPFEDLSISVSDTDSVEVALRQHTALEVLHGENAYLCSHCRRPCTAHKQLQLHHLPLTLVIHLKRFDFLSMLASKITSHVAYNSYIDLAEHCTAEAIEEVRNPPSPPQ